MKTINQQLHRSATHKKAYDPACPVCIRSRELSEKLARLDARHMNDCVGPNGGTLAFYRINGQSVIIQSFAEDKGYEVYAPIFNGNETKGTFEALDALAAAPYRTR
jgi:hypothetical protein